jgi:hypothetical protein
VPVPRAMLCCRQCAYALCRVRRSIRSLLEGEVTRWRASTSHCGSKGPRTLVDRAERTVSHSNRIEISRDTLAAICLHEIRMWPRCETVVSVGVLAALDDRFMLRVIEYGETKKNLADRALRCIEREKLRHYCLASDKSRRTCLKGAKTISN